MWNYINKLPHELVGQNVIGLLSVKDLVNLDSTRINSSIRISFYFTALFAFQISFTI